mgnify:CR=1 FL=1
MTHKTNVNESQKDLCFTSESLTKMLKQGRLLDNHYYYFKMPNGTTEVGKTSCLELLHNCKDGHKIQVFCEVPCYEEYVMLKKWCEEFNTLAVAKENRQLKTENKWYSEQLNAAAKEVIQLKDLLKESHDLVYELAFRLRKIPEIDKCNELREKIREVLGEEYGFEKHTYYVRERSKDNDR